MSNKLEGKQTPMGTIEVTERGFSIIRFKDRFDAPCSLQQSSTADFNPPGSSAVWLGVDRRTIPDTRMHLDLKQVKELIAVLEMWVQTGDFAE